MKRTEFVNLENDLLSEGYNYYLDPIDAEVAAENNCDHCGDDGVYAIGLKKDKSYRVFAICPNCDEVYEY